uniref:histidine kinase n=1 Tax=Chromera velia CCMP2878 TaxID=1169474 RepID=A0A0G4FJW9_9ALVE|eukprot:Cvel_17277.t1-p1 / transcript=Cvel_17277.t1 / gene=Cvel_17277 / organism=Chromera_velia_CCMP2878 / gene_product=Ethylene receptor, putative / transcript_product=Ethylene receptor, putative / location=Cvel_scaffold1370:24115-25945(+) / protein_length=563 / sequence_SO=supercontig / SO=protein_coding / is_pseudo=false
MFLNILDTVLWSLTGIVRSKSDSENFPEIAFFAVAAAPGPLLLAWGLRQLPLLTLADAEKEVQQRVAAEQARNVFFSDVMHEMRNPLSGATLLVHEFVGALKDMSRRIGKRRINLAEAREVVEETVIRLQQRSPPFWDRKHLNRGWWCQRSSRWKKAKSLHRFHSPPPGEFQCSTLKVDPEVHPILSAHPVAVADFTRLEQVISNFVSNAQKFTKSGSVKLKFEVTGDGRGGLVSTGSSPPIVVESKQASCARALKEKSDTESIAASADGLIWVCLKVSVTDTGAGLSKEDMGKLFEPYSQVRAGELQNGGGTGLGLCICKSFVEAHTEGYIGVESLGRGAGSTFFFRILVPLLDSSCVPTSSLGQKTHVNSVREVSDRSESVLSLLSDAMASSEDVTVGADLYPVMQREVRRVKEGGRRRMSTGAIRFSMADRKRLLAFREPGWDSKGDAENVQEHQDIKGNPQTRSDGQDTEKQVGALGTHEAVPTHDRHGTLPALGTATSREIVDVLLVDDDRFCLMAGSAAIKKLGFSVLTAEDGEEACEMIISQGFSFRFVFVDRNMA